VPHAGGPSFCKADSSEQMQSLHTHLVPLSSYSSHSGFVLPHRHLSSSTCWRLHPQRQVASLLCVCSSSSDTDLTHVLATTVM
jgi:hypothetical protein